MSNVRMVLMDKGKVDQDFILKMDKPEIGEIVSYNDNHYNIKFIQHVIDYLKKDLEYILITAIKE